MDNLAGQLPANEQGWRAGAGAGGRNHGGGQKGEEGTPPQVKSIAVLDSSVVVSAIGWQGDARAVLHLLARRCFLSVRTPWLTQEWAETVSRVSAEVKWHNPNWPNWIEWVKDASLLMEDPPVRATVRRDPRSEERR